MMPKISVSPEATRNSSSPYCSAFRHWIRKVARSMANRAPADGDAGRVRHQGWCDAYILQPRPGSASPLLGDADDLVLLALDLAQVDVLHRVVRLAERERRRAGCRSCAFSTAAANSAFFADVALDRGQADAEDLRRVVALHRVDVGLQLVGLGVGQCGRRCRAACSGRRRSAAWSACPAAASPCASSVPSVRKPAPYSGMRLLQAGRRVVLDELDRAAAGEEGVDRVGLGRRDLGQQRLELDVRERHG